MELVPVLRHFFLPNSLDFRLCYCSSLDPCYQAAARAPCLYSCLNSPLQKKVRVVTGCEKIAMKIEFRDLEMVFHVLARVVNRALATKMLATTTFRPLLLSLFTFCFYTLDDIFILSLHLEINN